jgi:protocatechuate 3,4-dioxygenase beta subunit
MPIALLPTAPYCTIGPFFPGEFVTGCEDLTSFQGKQAGGQHIMLTGRVVEEGNRPILNAILEIWQPDANGVLRHPADPRFDQADPGFFGWGRARTDVDGRYSFRTVLPGASTGRRRHINLMILAIGVTRRLVTTIFFDEAPGSSSDPVFDSVTDPAARGRMLARREGESGNGVPGIPVYRFDIVTRGESETPFFLD